MAKERKFDFAPLPIVSDINNDIEDNSSDTEINGVPTKVTFDCDYILLEKMKDYGYWEGLTQKDIILEALTRYFDAAEIRPRPDKIRNKTKVGRKPKALVN
ncbi:hypothetical protein [Dyadobacter sp. 3J3]|uniref:hypothetical protein n=1 Tax=Dyadobacter sp. 3J3 TaxID=2606600 RepID=UPI00135CEC13|nr:hypothetical protein [Dyadobacter sp. 3J3]